ncbi:DUF2786 domain-containing protein [Frankia sp. AiPa1]|uniref:DUF2786 domain-containing protein n=1 Tax=Frankia sp. AiPa1 TaxID=573492 RepID=UPI00202B0683|nr:DUF2786 domain-containing protein [Frankia sp. AiPa1]MCL9762508.1 DUF2786 domain-containing protein [Frankia sp. AiPa1]
MGIRNRERRKARQKARTERGRAQSGRSAAGGETDSARGLFNGGRPAYGTLPEIVDQLIGAAVNARLREDADQFTNCVQALVGVPQEARGRQVVNRCLLAWFDRVVEAAWQRGWQPVDVHRIVGRRASARHARLAVDAMAAEMRRYAAATVDERWQAQLRGLGATVWWERDEEWLDRWGHRESLDRSQTLADAVELLAVVHSLPPLESLCPPPGSARRDTTSGAASGGRTTAGDRSSSGARASSSSSGARAASGGRRASGAGRSTGTATGATDAGPTSVGATAAGGSDRRMLDRVRALLAKAESTEFAEEAEALTAKAQQLMARHSIDEALLAAGQGARETPAGRRVGIDNPYEIAKASLLDVVSDANRCRTVWSKSLGFATVIGFEPDLDAVELLYTSLLVQATTAMMRAGSRQDGAGRSRTRSFRQSFLASFATRIGQRLSAASEQAHAEAAAETGDGRLLPVLAARTDSVREATESMFPQIVAQAVRATDPEGWASGRAAADLATLHTRDEVTADRSG